MRTHSRVFNLNWTEARIIFCTNIFFQFIPWTDFLFIFMSQMGPCVCVKENAFSPNFRGILVWQHVSDGSFDPLFKTLQHNQPGQLPLSPERICFHLFATVAREEELLWICIFYWPSATVLLNWSHSGCFANSRRQSLLSSLGCSPEKSKIRKYMFATDFSQVLLNCNYDSKKNLWGCWELLVLWNLRLKPLVA